MTIPEAYLTTTEAAARLGIPRRTLQARIAAGTFPAEKRGRDWWVRESDLGTAAPPRGKRKRVAI